LGTNSFPLFSKPLKDGYFLLIEVAYVACAFIFWIWLKSFYISVDNIKNLINIRSYI
jgi:hypothetical protein